ncbi:nucleosome assembly protein 1-like 4 [Schistocerca americana]|uniref:nucleosome assembly protein 1-like 4 n=1 Tax=Schistocerca americana TaxID=7009 RepID=UPI001F4FE6F9|nr:nucleosome assembly protein 1-like 4 [Schistocerca americana]
MDRVKEQVDALKGAGDKNTAEKVPPEDSRRESTGAAERVETPEAAEKLGDEEAAAEPAGVVSGDAAQRGRASTSPGEEDAEVDAALARLAESAPDPAAFRRRVLRLLRDTERRMAESEEATPGAVRRRVRHLRYLQLGLAYLRAAFDKEVFQLQRRYHALLQPLRECRRLIAAGLAEPTAEECAGAAAEDAEAPPVSGIPNFWLRALRNSLTVGPLITERDAEVLRHLVDIRVVMEDREQPGFRLEFHFAPNDYIADSVLTKEFDVSFDPEPEDPLCGGGMRIVAMRGSGVTWKSPEADVTRHPRSGRTCDSCFHFFARDAPAGTSDDDELDAWERDVDVGLHLQSSLVPRAVLFYTGEAAQTDYSDSEYESYSSSSSSSQSLLERECEVYFTYGTLK